MSYIIYYMAWILGSRPWMTNLPPEAMGDINRINIYSKCGLSRGLNSWPQVMRGKYAAQGCGRHKSTRNADSVVVWTPSLKLWMTRLEIYGPKLRMTCIKAAPCKPKWNLSRDLNSSPQTVIHELYITYYIYNIINNIYILIYYIYIYIY